MHSGVRNGALTLTTPNATAAFLALLSPGRWTTLMMSLRWWMIVAVLLN